MELSFVKPANDDTSVVIRITPESTAEMEVVAEALAAFGEPQLADRQTSPHRLTDVNVGSVRLLASITDAVVELGESEASDDRLRDTAVEMGLFLSGAMRFISQEGPLVPDTIEGLE